MTLFNCGAAKYQQKQGRVSALQTLAFRNQSALALSESQLEHEKRYTALHSCELQLVQRVSGYAASKKVTGQSDHLAEQRCGSQQRSNCARARPPPC